MAKVWGKRSFFGDRGILFFMFDVILLAINANSGRIGDYMAKTKVVLASSDTLMNL